MRFKITLLCCFIGLTGTAGAANLDLHMQTALQTEHGGDLPHEDRIAHTALHMAPTLIWHWNRNKVAYDVRFAPAIDVPSYTSRAISALNGEWRARYASRWHTIFETRLNFGRVAFDQTTRWQSRSRINGDVGFSTALTPSCYLLGGYNFAVSHYQERPLQTGQITTSPQIGAISSATSGQDPQANISSLDNPAVDPSGASDQQNRQDHQHRLRATLMWVGMNYWVTSGVSFAQNTASLPAYAYRGTQVNLGGGVQYNAFGFSLQNSREWRGYHLSDGTPSSWRSWWTSVEATWQIRPWMHAFANIQKEYGHQDGQEAITPWTMTSAGLKFAFPLKKKKIETSPPREPLMPRQTKSGWVFRYRNVHAKNVHLIGTFSSWNPKKYALKRVPHQNGMWEITVKLDPGVYEYAFIVDGEDWVAPPQAPLYVDDGFGNRNGVLVVENKTELTARE